MKKKVLMVLVAILAIGQNAFADYFYAVAPSGQTLCYEINGNGSTVTVTYPGSDYYNPYGGHEKPTGALSIPASVTYNGTTYSVTSIGHNAFRGCSGLTSVTIPNSVTSIDNGAFGDCSGLTSVTIPNSVTSIGGSAFRGCTGLTSVTIPNSVTSIGTDAFESCTGLTSVTIGSGVTSIDNGAFSYCTGLTSLTIPNSVTSIDNGAFCGCSGLTSVTIPNSVTTIGCKVFRDCSSLTSVTIPNSVTSIGDYAFCDCCSLTSVIFNADSCITAGSDSYPIFYGCSNLTNITFGNNVRFIPSYLCSGRSGLTSVTIPNSVTSIGNSAFRYCTGLTSVTIPNSVTSIGYGSFRNCDHLTNITIGSSVATIGNQAFKGCTQIVNFHMRGSNPPTVQANTFEDVPSSANLYVPCDATTAYANAAYWSQFSMAEELSYSFSATTADQTKGMVQVIHAPECGNLQAEVQATPYNGFHFVRWSDGNTDAHRYLVVVQDTAIQAVFSDGTEGIGEVDASNANVYINNGQIVVEGSEGAQVWLYDINGRLLATKQDHCTTLRFDVQASGTYLVKIGNYPARRIVVIR